MDRLQFFGLACAAVAAVIIGFVVSNSEIIEPTVTCTENAQMQQIPVSQMCPK